MFAMSLTFGPSAPKVSSVTGLCFDVGGNRYRLAAVIHYNTQRIYVRHVMTHAEYDRNRWRKR